MLGSRPVSTDKLKPQPAASGSDGGGTYQLRKLLSRASFNVVQLDHSQYTDDIAEPNGSDYSDVVRLDRSDYTDVR